jgi:ribonucleoside-triphosphate reductase
MPVDVNWEDLGMFEKEDNTTGSQELACTGGACEIV